MDQFQDCCNNWSLNLGFCYLVLKWNVINLLLKSVFQVFIVALYHEKVPDLNSCLALLPTCKPELARAAIRVSSSRKEFKFSNFLNDKWPQFKLEKYPSKVG